MCAGRHGSPSLRAPPSHGLVRLNTLLRGATLLRTTPYAGLMMLLASQDFRRRVLGPGPSPDGRGVRARA
ncbi:hypothetical protein EA462_04270 [Natrarchaeobius halalkaliphilus]|uniref:Uncharacterized protein n=1 Tax=Natrarchaeobius halalkaliphilus TaxID=1679091 RepID=A0A3N6N027_9EURY|nr:hypothetical protein EA462_04270 [Natrarchaeobius halalkaliphilus]